MNLRWDSNKKPVPFRRRPCVLVCTKTKIPVQDDEYNYHDSLQARLIYLAILLPVKYVCYAARLGFVAL